jgi:hypothetical protein
MILTTVFTVDLSLNSACSICCGFVVQQVVQQIHNKSTANPQLFDFSTNPQQIHYISTCQDVVALLWTQQQIRNKSKKWSMAFDLSTTSRKAVQQIHSKSTTNRTTGV